MLDENVYKIKYDDSNGNKKEKWVNEFAVFTEIERLEKDGCINITIC